MFMKIICLSTFKKLYFLKASTLQEKKSQIFANQNLKRRQALLYYISKAQN